MTSLQLKNRNWIHFTEWNHLDLTDSHFGFYACCHLDFTLPCGSLSKTQVEVPWLPPNNGRPDPQDRFWRREHCGARLSQIYSLLWENFGRRFSKDFCFPKIFRFIPAATTFVPPIIVCLIALWTFGLKLDTRVFFLQMLIVNFVSMVLTKRTLIYITFFLFV